MAGIVFIKTKDLESSVNFYTNVIGAKKWLSQPSIEILKHGNLLFGLHEQKNIDRELLLTFFYETKKEVDEMYEKLEEEAVSKPSENEKYKIYNFFAKDPEGRDIEFQTFLHDLPEY